MIVGAILATQGLADNEPIMTPGAHQLLAACVTVGGIPVSGEVVYFGTSVNTQSGFHSHTAGRPLGSFYTSGAPGVNETASAVSGGDGCARVEWYAPNAAGYHTILANTTIAGMSTFFIQVDTRQVTGWLHPLPASQDYTFSGWTADHPTSHYGTVTAVEGIQNIMRDFRAQTGLVASVNDMSLPWGGTFDLGPAYASASCPVPAVNYWTNSCAHAEHRTGRNADIPYTPLGGERARFYTIALLYGAGDGVGGIKSEGNHYHLRFNY
jgi:hypothetical protein